MKKDAGIEGGMVLGCLGVACIRRGAAMLRRISYDGLLVVSKWLGIGQAAQDLL